MDLDKFISKLKEKAAGRAGMILVHDGVVRGFSRGGNPVKAVEIEVNRGRLGEIMEAARALPGIVAADCEIREGRLEVGEDIMLLGIAGDIRENVLRAMEVTLNRIKAEVTRKREIMP